jgi:SpoVK/Ycf46/Vps4 family AAA+-type ATPase
MAPKRKLLEFDPNKSDSDDVDFELEAPSRTSRKSVGRSKSKTKSKKRKQKKRRINGSDISDDDVSDSLMEDSFEESEVEEEPEVDSETGRPKRRAKAKRVSYEESGSEESEESHSDDDEEEDDRHLATPSPKKRLVVKLKLPTPKPTTARSTRAGSMARSTRGKSIEAATASGKPRRATRAHTEEAEEFVELSTSGRHAVVRGSTSPQGVLRRKYSNKGIKKPATSVVLEVSHEDVTQDIDAEHDADAADTTGTDVPDVVELLDKVIHDSHSIRDADLTEDELAGETQANETVDSAPAHAKDDEDDDDEDEMPIKRSGRATRASKPEIVEEADDTPVISDIVPEATENTGRRNLRQRKSRSRKRNEDQTSDFEPMEESAEEDISASDASPKKGKNSSNDTDESPRGRGGRRGRGSRRHSSVDEELDMDELAEEAAELKPSSRRRTRINQDPEIVYQPSRRKTKPVDYTIKPMDQIYAQDEDADEPAPSPTRRTGRRGGNSQPWERSLHPTYGPFGGATVGGPWGTGAAGGADSDSSDDENMARPTTGNVPTTPSSAVPPGLLPGLAQTNDPVAAMGGNTLGKIKSQKALADADPLGVDQNVDFSKVGGLAGHIDQLKEMVQMPLLYPELFQKFHVTPPRGVLFHGPPGTGKTLLARALAAQTSSGGRKITFYMRKGADALSKWVGEAERQLRLLFEEARKTQPSIIFFDEIDGLAPVRSSKQEQIHASIVSTLLALMDGMDGRGQVIVIGATNRPDNIDPALRRPGRFDREFYFPLPDVDARRSIIDIHTKDWGIDDRFKDSLAHLTKGYGGADLRALCTEAALNSIQRTYPQIYSSNDKLIVDADKIKVTAKDFMLSVKKMIPSSERATSSGAAPLPKAVEPLLREQLADIEKILDGLLPQKKKVTALQEAMYEQYDDEDHGFGREVLQQEFEQSRVFRPRLLIGGIPGMGQAYLGSALLNHFEGLHVQSFDLPTIFSDSGRSAETAIVQLFAEVKRHKPSVIYLPGVDTWWQTLSDSVLTTFVGLLKNLPPTDPVLVLGICDNEPDKADSNLLANLFSYTRKCRFVIQRPSRVSLLLTCLHNLLTPHCRQHVPTSSKTLSNISGNNRRIFQIQRTESCAD